MGNFEPFQKRFQQSAHKQEYRGGGCGDRGGAHVDPVPGAAAADITIVRPQPEFVKKKAATPSNAERGSGCAVSRAPVLRDMGNFEQTAEADITERPLLSLDG